MSDSFEVSAGIPGEAHTNARIYFQVSSINDMQGTIRAIDTKVSILLAALAIPIHEVVTILTSWRTRGFAFSASDIFLALALLAYALAAYLAIKTLVGIGDATMHVRGVRLENSFYAGGMFQLSWLDALFSRTALKSRTDVDGFISELPKDRDSMIEELAIETIAIAYIRDLKLLRQRLAFMTTMAAAGLGAIGLIV